VRRIPLWLKIGWTAWTALWAVAYALHHGPENFLWFCDLANFAIAAALWIESPLLLSWQAVSVLLVQILYLVDVAVRFFLGFYPIGATKFMFDEKIPVEIRLLSLCMHVGTPPVLLWCLGRLGYDRRALPLQVATAAVVLGVSWFGGPDRNVNWSWGPLFRAQQVVAPVLYLPVAVVGYTILLYLPAHFFFSRIWPRRAPEPPGKTGIPGYE
jgi:hypothetical protein